MTWEKQSSGPSNKTTLDKLSDNGTSLLFNNTPIGSGSADTSYMKYVGKKVYCFGDSITQLVSGSYPDRSNNYPYHLQTKLGANITNHGSSGADHNRLRVIVCGGTSNGGLTFTVPSYTNVDVVTLTIGHNGGVGTSTISDISGISDFNLYPDTYYGNVCRSIEFILNQKQDIKIYLLTPIQSLNSGYATSTAAATTALKTIGSKYALPVIDLQNTSGLHFRNLSLYTSDGTHPTPNGAKMIAEIVFRQMLSY
jgi:lysophospholipase L1-like esterase